MMYLGATIAALAATLAAQTPSTGVIRGKVSFLGPAPARNALVVDVNTEVCAAHGATMGEDLLVSGDQGLANAVVFLAGITERKPQRRSGQLDQRGCVFVPHMQAMTLGSELVIGNDDPVVHNVHGRVGGETVFNLGMPIKGIHIKRKLKVPGVTTLSCDSGHTWMQAYIVVVPHSYHSTSDAAGQFTISGVSPGSYTLRAWHERLGSVDVAVKVEAGKETVIALDYPASRAPSEALPPLSFSLDAPAVLAEELPRAAETPTIDAPPSSGLASGEEILAAAVDPEVERAPRLARRDADIARGRASYLRHCASCHGDRGDGRGEAARYLRSRPRDFTKGELEFRSTRSGEPALEEDIVRTISVGLPGTDMRSFAAVLPPSERRILARYVMSFSDRYLRSAPAVAVPIPAEPTSDSASIGRGKQLWERLKCAQCHGADGRADGVSRRLVDDWGQPIRAADLTRGVYKSGTSGKDLYRSLATGLSGTPMPAFVDLVSAEEIWDLVHYVQSLAREPGFFDWLARPAR